MADEYKREAIDWSGKNEESKDESNEEEIIGDGKQNKTIADVGKDEMNVEGKDEGSVEIKEVESSAPFTEDLNKSGSEMNDAINDLEETPKVAKKEKSKPVKKGLLDEPVVREGKRQRHAVERLAAVSSPPSKKASLDAVGSGTSLGDIEFVNTGISKAQNETLKWLHRLCYGTPGTATSRKRDLRRFNGFAFDEKSADFDKKKAAAMKLTNNELHMIGRILGSERGHTKEEAVMNVLHFLQKPEDKGRKITSIKKRRSSSKSSGKKAKRSRTEKKGNKKSTKKLKEESNENDDAGQSGEESSGDEDAEEKKSDSTGTTKNRSEKMKGSSKLISVSKSLTEDPTWGDGGPSNAEVENAINEILRSVDLVNCTMKQMCERIAEKFPNLDMATYKGALKERVKAALEKMEDS
ncbi:DEK C terminal domain family protein [Acanthocheilonema viteae]